MTLGHVVDAMLDSRMQGWRVSDPGRAPVSYIVNRYSAGCPQVRRGMEGRFSRAVPLWVRGKGRRVRDGRPVAVVDQARTRLRLERVVIPTEREWEAVGPVSTDVGNGRKS